MADTKISNLTALAAAPDSGDFFAIVDTSASATKKLAAAYLPALGGTLAQFAATTSAQLAGVISDETGTDALVFANTPTLVTPILGVATATSINKVAITAPATSATLTIADGKTLTVNDNVTLAGAHTLTVPADMTAAGVGYANVFTATQTVQGANNSDTHQLILRDLSSSTAYLHTGQYSDTSYIANNYFYNGGHTTDDAAKASSLLVMAGGAVTFSTAIASATPTMVEALRVHASAHTSVGTTTDSGQLTVNGELAIVDGMTAPSTTSGWAKIYVDSADGDLKVKFGDGTVKTISTDS